jgi:hypothetical protein
MTERFNGLAHIGWIEGSYMIFLTLHVLYVYQRCRRHCPKGIEFT